MQTSHQDLTCSRNWASNLFFIFAFLSTFIPLRQGAIAEDTHPAPNIVFILADDLGFGILAAMGSEL